MKGRRDHKPQRGVYSQSKRREDALKRLREERAKKQNTQRRLQLESQGESASKNECKVGEEKTLAQLLQDGLNLSEEQSKPESTPETDVVLEHTELMQAHWMTEFPTDLARNWLVTPRPEGRRCLIDASKARTVSHLKNGGVLHRFKSSLPGGASLVDGPSLLDCVFHEPDQTYYVMDILCWNGVRVTDCEALFRLQWIKPKLEECTSTTANVDSSFTFDAPAWYDCDEKGVLTALYDFVPFTRDGICLLHKEGRYVQGPNELSLLWKDLTCSRYLVETDMDGNATERQSMILRLADNGALYTGDDPPICFTDLMQCTVDGCIPEEKLKKQQLMTFHLHETSVNGTAVGMHLEFVNFVRNRRRNADLFSKIIFQRFAREGSVRSHDLIQAIRHQQTGTQEADMHDVDAND